VLGAATVAAQAVANRATAYLHPTDVIDARAIWVNPAGLAGLTMASVYLDLTVGQPGGRGRLRQLSGGFDSRGFAFSYQRDILDGGGRGHTYKVGLGGGNGPLAAGFGMALYRGDTKGTGWDLGLRYVPSRAVRVGGAILNIGEPSVGREAARHIRAGSLLRALRAARRALSSRARYDGGRARLRRRRAGEPRSGGSPAPARHRPSVPPVGIRHRIVDRRPGSPGDGRLDAR